MQNLLKQEKKAELDDVYEFAKMRNVEVCDFKLPLTGAISFMDESGKCAIGIDNSKRYTVAQKKTMLMHELGHCETGAFYNMYTPFCPRSKCERRADEWAIVHFLPYDSLIKAYRSGLCTNYELAEYFEVSEQFIQKAIDYYLQKR